MWLFRLLWCLETFVCYISDIRCIKMTNVLPPVYKEYTMFAREGVKWPCSFWRRDMDLNDVFQCYLSDDEITAPLKRTNYNQPESYCSEMFDNSISVWIIWYSNAGKSWPAAKTPNWKDALSEIFGISVKQNQAGSMTILVVFQTVTLCQLLLLFRWICSKRRL